MEQVYLFKSDIQEIPKIRESLSDLAKEWMIPASERGQIEVIIEEIFSNIIRFAYQDKNPHTVEIRMKREEFQVGIEIIDDGIPFNPLDYQAGSITDPASSDAGGMGLTLIQTFSDSIVYSRLGTRNHLNIVKKIKSKP